MNKQEECFIIKDLAVCYIENMTSPITTEFIKRHLENCENCEKYYNDMKSDVFKDNIKENAKEDIEVNHLKKISHYINKLKFIIISIFLTLIIIFSVFSINVNKVNTIINGSYNQINKMKIVDNYKFSIKTIHKDYKNEDYSYEVDDIYYYKDGKYKEELADAIFFYEDNSYNKITIHNDVKKIGYYKNNFIEFTKGQVFNTFSEIINYKKHGFNIFDMNIKEDTYNGIECFIINLGDENDYKQIWIEKDSYMVIRKVAENKGFYYDEEIFTFEKDIVKDSDIDTSILNSDEYKDYIIKNIENNYTGERLTLYGKYNKLST